MVEVTLVVLVEPLSCIGTNYTGEEMLQSEFEEFVIEGGKSQELRCEE